MTDPGTRLSRTATMENLVILSTEPCTRLLWNPFIIAAIRRRACCCFSPKNQIQCLQQQQRGELLLLQWTAMKQKSRYFRIGRPILCHIETLITTWPVGFAGLIANLVESTSLCAEGMVTSLTHRMICFGGRENFDTRGAVERSSAAVRMNRIPVLY